jgi:hypothetical protein
MAIIRCSRSCEALVICSASACSADFLGALPALFSGGGGVVGVLAGTGVSDADEMEGAADSCAMAGRASVKSRRGSDNFMGFASGNEFPVILALVSILNSNFNKYHDLFSILRVFGGVSKLKMETRKAEIWTA